MAPCVCFPAVLLHIRANGLQVFPFKSSKLTLAKVSFLPANMLVFLTLAVFFFSQVTYLLPYLLFISTCIVVVVFPSLMLTFWVSRPDQLTVICVRRSVDMSDLQ